MRRHALLTLPLAGLSLAAGVSAVVAAWTAFTLPAMAQPDASFRAECNEVRAKLDALAKPTDGYFNIQVVGAVQAVGRGEGAAFLGLCGPPAPRILCVTYELDAWKVGDRVMVTGTFNEDRPGYIKLDPCLHSRLPG